MNFQLDKLRVFDSHCHPQFSQYAQDREETIRRALDGGVFIICVGTDYETSKLAIELAQKTEGIWASIGLHPNNIGLVRQVESSSCLSSQLDKLYELEELLTQPKVVAIGEIGLDYYRTLEEDKQEKQKKIFKQFLDLAIKYDKPVILHARDSGKGSAGRVHSDMIGILNSKFQISNSKLRGVAHSFTGTSDEAKKYLDLGFYLGFNGIITFAHQYDEVVKYVPLENILLETDAPYLTPEPYRGQRNEPIYVKEVAKKVAKLKDLPVDEVITKTTQNIINLFKINI